MLHPANNRSSITVINAADGGQALIDGVVRFGNVKIPVVNGKATEIPVGLLKNTRPFEFADRSGNVYSAGVVSFTNDGNLIPPPNLYGMLVDAHVNIFRLKKALAAVNERCDALLEKIEYTGMDFMIDETADETRSR